MFCNEVHFIIKAISKRAEAKAKAQVVILLSKARAK